MNIEIRGCKTFNLKDISLDIPMNKITCVTGPSGCGKSSLVFHTIANESKRKFLNSQSSSFTFFDRVPQTAQVDSIVPVLPVWVLEQHNPIVGSRLNLSDQFELTLDIAKLYFEPNSSVCPIHGHEFLSVSDIVRDQCSRNISSDEDIFHFFIDGDKYLENLGTTSSRSFCMDRNTISKFVNKDAHWELFRIRATRLSTVAKKLAEFNFLQNQVIPILVINGRTGKRLHISSEYKKVCSKCKKLNLRTPNSIDELLPFNGVGACGECRGYGSILNYSESKIVKYPNRTIKDGAISIFKYSRFEYHLKDFLQVLKKDGISLTENYENIRSRVWPILRDGRGRFPGIFNILREMEQKRFKKNIRIFLRSIQTENICSTCSGLRVSSYIGEYQAIHNLPRYGELLSFDISRVWEVLSNFSSIDKEKLKLKKKILDKLKIIKDFNLGSFSLSQRLKDLESNEYQKSLLIRYLCFNGTGSLFVLDEPSLGLTKSDQKILLKYLKILSRSNTVIIVDHSRYLQESSDHIIEMGPHAGINGGEIIYEGKFNKKDEVIKFSKTKLVSNENLVFKKINFKKFDINELVIPIGTVSTVESFRDSFSKRLFIDVIANELTLICKGEKSNFDVNYTIGKAVNCNSFEDVIVYETKIERASGRSTVGTILGLSPFLRKYYASLDISKSLALKDGHFSPNSELGRCGECEGKGIQNIDMHFLSDIVIKCEECDGKKLKKFYASISDENYSIYEAYNIPISTLFSNLRKTAKIQRVIDNLEKLNLGYLNLDRTLPSLSGGERLRVKLLSSLQKEIKNSFLVFSDISYGLSNVELINIRELILSLLLKNNTVIVLDNHPIFKDFHVVSAKSD